MEARIESIKQSQTDSEDSRSRQSADPSVLGRQMKFRFRETVLIELARHGIIPREDTPPELVHQFVSDLHLFEIRRLRERFLAVQIPKAEYAGAVEAVTK